MKLLSGLFALSITAGQAPNGLVQARHTFRALQEATEAPVEEATTDAPDAPASDNGQGFTDEQCNNWVAGAYVEDADSSGGLSEEEFQAFLLNIDDPPYVKEYLDQLEGGAFEELPWYLRIAHKSLACRCRELGFGDDCCEGPDAELPLLGLTEDEFNALTQAQQTTVLEYRDDVCGMIAAVIKKSIPSPAPTILEIVETAPPVAAPVEVPDAPENGIVYECANATSCNENDPSRDPTSGWNTVGDCGPGTDVGDCPPAHSGDMSYDVGDQASLGGFAPEPTPLMEIDIVGSVVDFCDGYDAEAVATNEDENGVLGDVIKGFAELANSLSPTAEGKMRKLRARALQLSSMGKLEPVQVTDISKWQIYV